MAAAAYPPELGADELAQQASDWALSHGLVVRAAPSSPSSTEAVAVSPHGLGAALHAPYTLTPSLFPRALFDEALRLQGLYNVLYARAATDAAFLERVVGHAVARVDDFQRRLYDIYRRTTGGTGQARDEGSSQGSRARIQLGLFRSDYLIHSDARTGAQHLKQVEFNTISSSFGALASKVSDMHRFLQRSGAYAQGQDDRLKLDNMPRNGALAGLSAGLAAAHAAYGNPRAVVLFVVQDGERNAFDQRALEWQLFERHGAIAVLRLSFRELHARAAVDADDGTLRIDGVHEVAVVYYRAGYGPADYDDERAWDTRLALERSSAIKCPSVALQLAGSKKVQQVLAEPGELERFLDQGACASELDPAPVHRLDLTDAAHLLASFAGLWPMDDTPLGLEGQRLARAEPHRFVLKPQREGGGNNVYRDAIPPFLDELDRRDAGLDAGAPRYREAYILMELIESPADQQAWMSKKGTERATRATDVVSELGIYGVALFDDSGTILANETVGHLLRTKARESDEGGVAVGFSVIDSPLLV